MKKIIVLLLTLLIVAAFFITAASAVELDKPYIKQGSLLYDGNYSNVFQTIGGCYGFTTNFNLSDNIILESPAYVIEDYRDENGFGDVVHRLDLVFEYGIGWNTTVQNFKGLAFIFVGQGTYPQGKLRQIALIDWQDQLYYIWVYNEATDPDLRNLESSYIYFGPSLSNYCTSIDPEIEFAYWFPTIFSSNISRSDALAGGSLADVGLMKPIFFEDASGGGGGGTGSEPSKGFTAFFSLILSFFAGILAIPFFGGLFTLGDLIGVVVVFSFLILFIRWFAGG